jgi:hypothetical protein
MDWIGIDTDEKVVAAYEMKGAVDAFMLLGVAQVQAASNDRRIWLSANGGVELSRRLLPGGNLQVALGELARPFTLVVPNGLAVEFLPGPHPNPLCPMMCHTTTPVRITVDATALDVPHLSVRHFPMSIRDCTFHEMIHACGDVLDDGIYRVNFAAVEAINRVRAGLPAAG